MTDLRALLAPIRTRLAAATPGPWRLAHPRPDGRNMVDRPGYDLYGGEVSEMIIVDTNPSDAELIANAPADLARLLAAIEAVAGLHRTIKIYDEFDCPEGTHPEDYDYIDCEDFNGCENSVVGIGCDECCVHGDYLSQECGEYHMHSLDPEKRCATITALAAALGSDTTNQEDVA